MHRQRIKLNKTPHGCLLMLIALLATHQMYAQNIIRGTIIDEANSPIAFASIQFKKDSIGPVLFYGLTNRQGAYTLSVNNAVSGFLSVSSVGYTARLIPVNILNTDTTRINVVLLKNLKVLPEVVINNLPAVVVSGDTTSYSAERFTRGNESSLGELLDNIPGFRTLPGGLVTYNGRIIDRILINGDDLTGAGYQKLTQNLDINGIEQLQVIQNFMSDENILSEFLNGQEQVLNIKYKAGFLSKIFGSIDGAAGLPSRHYNSGLQALRIFDKTKLLGMARVNSTGLLNNDPTRLTISDQIGSNPEYDLDFPQRDFLSGVELLRTGIPELNAIHRNNSSFGTLNLFSRPRDQFSIRGQFNYVYDHFRQAGSSRVDYISAPNFSILQNNQLAGKPSELNGLLSANYYPTKKQQVRLTVKAKSARLRTLSETNLSNGVSYSEATKGKNANFGAKLFYNHILSKNLAWTFDGEYVAGKQSNTYSVLPPILTDFFELSGAFTQLSQPERQRYRYLHINTKLLRHFQQYRLQLSAYYRHHIDEVRNDIFALSSQTTKEVGADSVNNTRNRTFSSGVIFQSSWEPLAGLSVSGSLNLAFTENYLTNQSTQERKRNYHALRIVPSASISWQLSRENRISISYTQNPQFSEARQSGTGYVIRNATSFYENVDTAQFGINSNLSLLYSFQSPIRKRQMLFVNFTYFNSPGFLLTGVESLNQLAFIRFSFTEKRTKFLNLITTFLFFSKNYKTQVIPGIRLSRGSRYNLVQGAEQLVKFDQLEGSLAMNHRLGAFQIKSNWKYTIQRQSFGSRFISRQFASNWAVNYKFSSRWFAETGLHYFGIDSKAQRFNDYLATSCKVLYKLKKDKIELSLAVSNAINRKKFTSILVSDTHQTISDYQLFPRFVLAGAKFKF